MIKDGTYIGPHPMDFRKCEFCGDEFEAHHGLQRYCPEKYGRKDYCKYEHKKLVTEEKLVTLIGDLGNALHPKIEPLNPLERNIQILESILGNNKETITNSDVLDSMGFDQKTYSRSHIEESSGYTTLVIGTINLDWIDTDGTFYKFKLKRSWT